MEKLGDKEMKEKEGISIRRLARCVSILAIVFFVMLLSRVLANSRTPVPLRPRNVPIPEAQKERIAKRIASGYGLGQFQASLEMKENADFVLTPALLVQEALSDDTIMTYPTE